MSGCASLPPTIPCKCEKKKRTRETDSASRAWGCRAQHLYRKPASFTTRRRAWDRGSVYMIFLFFIFCIVSLSLVSFPKDFYLGEEPNSSPPGAMRACPHRARLQICHPPCPWVAKRPCTSTGSARRRTCARAGLGVCVALEGDGRVKPVHTRKSTHPARAPGSEFPRHAYPGGGAGGYPKVRRA